MQPERFGRYEVVAEVGDGAMGRYLTRDQAAEYLKRFRREAQAAGSLNTRPRPRPTPETVMEGQLVEIGPGVTPPRRIEGSPPSYPYTARRRRLEGSVTVSMIVTETGETTDLTVTESGGKALDKAVLEAVRDWRFEPARKDGVKVRVPWSIRHTFKARR
jgi:TonB family protein